MSDMRIRSRETALAAALAIGAITLAAPASGQTITPVDIPASYGIGTMGGTIQGWIVNNDASQIRQRGWQVWAGLNAASGQSYNGTALPVWETWLGTEELFGSGAVSTAVACGTTSGTVQAASGPKAPPRSFINPNQFSHLGRMATAKGAKAATAPTPADSQVSSFNKFSPSAACYIASPQTVVGLHGTYTVNSQKGLNALNAAFTAANAPVNVRSTNDFPTDALELKPVFGVVKSTSLTPMPMWQGNTPGTNTNATNPTPDTWKTCVLIDPTATGNTVQPATQQQAQAGLAAAQAAGLACTNFLYGPLTLFYNFAMSAAEATAIAQTQGLSNVAAGDYAVLLAMHVSSKEMPFWTWQTFYWQPGADTPNQFPGYKSDAPSSLPAPFNNYAMCTAYSQTTTYNGTTVAVCFNPYLETSPGIPAGITSNCMSCHGLAGVGTGPTYPASYTAPINFFANSTYFNNQSTRTDFSWAVAGSQ